MEKIIYFVWGIFLGALIGFSLTANALETRTRVAIIDTGIDFEKAQPYLCADGHKDFTGRGLNDVNNHGTNIAGIYAKRMNTKTHCLMIIKFFHDFEADTEYVIVALEHAKRYKAKYVNLSLSGATGIPREEFAIEELLNQGAIVAVAAGNEGINLSKTCKAFPACYPFTSKNFIVVGNKNSARSNYGGPVTVIEEGMNITGFGITMSGTSQATANYLSKRLK